MMILILLAIAGSGTANARLPGLEKILKKARATHKETIFQPPSPKTRRIVTQVVTDLTRSCDAKTVDRAKEALRPLAMEIIEAGRGADRFYVLRETPPVFRGLGVYVMRRGPAKGLCVQAPHGFFDQGTFPIGLNTFLDTKAKWFMTNTLHRYKSRRGEDKKDKNHPADCAHNANLLFQAITKGIAMAKPQTLFVQLHGFGKKSHPDMDIVVSTGMEKHNKPAITVAVALNALASKILVFGRDKPADKLAATSNVQGQWLNRHNCRFLHIEMAEDLRNRLKSNDGLIRILSNALVRLVNEGH